MTEAAHNWSGFVRMEETGEGARACLDLAVDGISCAACMVSIERGLQDLPGVDKARLNLTTHRLSLMWDPLQTSAESLVETLSRIGYRAHPFDPARRDENEAQESKQLLRAMAVAGFAAMNIMLLSVSVWAGNATDIDPETRDFMHWVSALIAIPAVAYSGRPFFRNALSALKARRLNMDVPISIGVLLALVLSLIQTFNHATDAYFDSAVMLLFFLLIGRYLDRSMRRKTRAYAENLAALRAESATRMTAGGGLEVIPLSAIEPGDQILVAAGERITVDGTVREGASEIDKSLITGETVPEAVFAGAQVFAGTINGSGVLRIEARAKADDSLLAEVERLLEGAMNARSSRLVLADKAAQLYAPLVHGAALISFLGWLLAGAGWQQALLVAVSTLIITCPCALGLAIPAVQVVASGTLFRHRILLASGEALERLAEADTVVFDKTGTLTRPRPVLAADCAASPADAIAAGAMARVSNHPLAQALQALGDDSQASAVTEVPGQGLEGVVAGERCRLGSIAFCHAEAEAGHIRITHPDASFVALRRGDAPPVVFPVVQALRDDARFVVDALRAMGLPIAILSGDREDAVRPVAEALGIDTLAAGLTPAGKIERLEMMKAEGRKVLMIGDGLNDAAALAAAHVSLSPISAVQLAQAASDGVFLGDSLQPVLATLKVSRRARALMTQNLLIAAVYNAIAVPFAVLGYVTPLVAALAMSGSSVVVTLNALRAGQMTGKAADTQGC